MAINDLQEDSVPKKRGIQKEHFPILLMAVVAFFLVAGTSIHRFRSYNAGLLDLGYMSQAIWSAGEGDLLLVSSRTGVFSRIMGHSEFIYFPLALIYKVIPSPAVLLAIQALFYAFAAVPLYFLSYEKLKKPKLALYIGATYLFYPVAMTATLFDFHGDTLAMPLLIVALYYLERKKGFLYGAFILLALACKIYVALPVFLLAMILLLKKRTKFGMITILIIILWVGFVFIIRQQTYGGTIASEATRQVSAYATNYYGELIDGILVDFEERIVNLLIVLLPCVFIGWKSWIWMVPGLSIIGSALISTGSGPVYDYRFHHYALAIPFIMMAIIDGISATNPGSNKISLLNRIGRIFTREVKLIGTVVITVVLNILLVQTPLSPLFYFSPYLGSNELPINSRDYRDEIKDHISDNLIPDSVPVLADLFIGTHLSNRAEIYSTYYTDLVGENSYDYLPDLTRIIDRVEYVVIDVFSVYFSNQISGEILHDNDLSVVFSEDGLIVFSKDKNLGDAWISEYDIVKNEEDGESKPLGVINVNATEFGGEEGALYQMSYEMIVSPNNPVNKNSVLVTTAVNNNNIQIIHTPALFGVWNKDWVAGYTYKEVFYFVIPEIVERGTYLLQTAWYDAPDLGKLQINDSARITEVIVEGYLNVR